MEKPGQTVHESVDFLTESQFGVPYHDSGNVYCQITVAFEQIGSGEGDENQTELQDRVQGAVRQVDLVDKPYGKLPERETYHTTEQELDEQVLSHQSNI